MKTRLLLAVFFFLSGTSICPAQEHSDNNVRVKITPTDGGESQVIKNLNKLLDEGKVELVEKTVRQQLIKYPHDADYLILQAKILHKSGKTAEAIRSLRLARGYAKSYEDIYLLEAGYLNEQDAMQVCKSRTNLANEYYKYTSAKLADEFEKRVGTSRQGKNELQVDFSRDELTNNRSAWKSVGVRNKWSSCTGQNIYLGYNMVERYQRNDEEIILGGGFRYGIVGIELEYRQSREEDILAQQSWSGLMGVGTGFSADVLISGSIKKYNGIETRTIGVGVDYYIGNYQIMAISDQTEYLRDKEELDESRGERYYLAYYFSRLSYIRYGYITGKELENDGSQNPPYSKIKTVLLTAALSISSNASFVIELKRHHQSGYYEQNGLNVSIRYSYQ